jgi:hypothetical protein
MFEQGKYRGRIVDYGIFRSQAGQQHPTVFIDFDLLGQYDPVTGELVECPPESASYLKAITPKTIDWVLSDLKAVGYDRPGFEYLDPETPGAVDLFGREFDAVCDHEVFEGDTRAKWSIARDRARAKVDRDELARLDNLYADQIRKAFPDGQLAAAPVPVPNTNDDEAF